MSPDWSDLLIRPLKLLIRPLKAVRVCTGFPRRGLGDKSCTYHAQSVARTSFARGVCASYPGPRGREYSYHAEPWRACTCLCLCTLSAS